MSWTNYFDEIYVINLPERKDRLLEVCEEMDKYDIPFKLVDGIKHESGAEGLRLVVENILKEAIEKNYKAILIFEDDCMWVENPNGVIEKALEQLPDDWHILFLGAQCTRGFKYRAGTNLLQLDGAYATHAWAISLTGMKYILSEGLTAPIDNCIVDKVQTAQKCFITYPLLATQRTGFSSIGNADINWDAFITPRYYQKLAELK